MGTLADHLRAVPTFERPDIEWLHLLVGDWQLIADLSFSDLILWVPSGGEEWLAVAHVRPNTGAMVFYDDIVGSTASSGRRAVLDEALRTQRVIAKPAPTYREDTAVREEAVPVVRDGRCIAVMTRHTNLSSGRTPGRLEVVYRGLADALAAMIAAGEFPSPSAPTGARRGAPRVGDGVIQLTAEGVVSYASPNAVSAIHRLGHVGDVVGESLPRVAADLLSSAGSAVDESLAVVTTGRAPWWSELETRAATVTLRAIPLTVGGVRTGALVLVRDVSELRRREQELITKDATIREIHHRVKNNLQTVAALLRLQARRVPDPTAQSALAEAGRRVGTIALVHETLSHGFDETVEFDEIALQGLRAVIEVATSEQYVESALTGTFGRLRAEDATSIAMVMSELVQNAVEHGLAEHGGRVAVHAERSVDAHGAEILTVTVSDNGRGLPTGFRPGLAGLGTRIVTSLVQDLSGRIRWEPLATGGTRVEFVAVLRATRT